MAGICLGAYTEDGEAGTLEQKLSELILNYKQKAEGKNWGWQEALKPQSPPQVMHFLQEGLPS